MATRFRRDLHVRVKTARGRPGSSTRWLERQLNDPYVAAAHGAGYRSRAAFKLIEIDDRYHFLKPGIRVLDLGAAPGSWTQVAVARVKTSGKAQGTGFVLAVDLQPMADVAGAEVLKLDMRQSEAPEMIKAVLGGPVDVVLSDMAAPTTGHAMTDHLRIMDLCETAFDLACGILRPGGTFLAKVRSGGSEGTLLARMKQRFREVRHVKPRASRKESAEIYVLALGFRDR